MSNKRRILLIDDEEIFTQLLKANLEATGRYTVQVENQGSLGLAAARAFAPDLILLDVVMPDIDGTQLAMALQADPKLQGMSIVYLTAVASSRSPQASALRGQTVLAKPVATEEVLACLERITRKLERDADSGVLSSEMAPSVELTQEEG
ncbi:MAG: response regulator [Candidatus Omnitrophica bacterium CG11_big_fil_rev_8_21_14_0_20_63_9]|nr:MAG: response regulator [Candidatus Omnitrophica bacterium CG11_big_fil_rev_8_21_14_0_20_63_9]